MHIQKVVVHALLVTVMVVATIFVVRKIPVVGGYVDQAISG